MRALTPQPPAENVLAIPLLTTGQYFDTLRDAYQAAGYELDADWSSWLGIPKEDSRAWYCRFGDCREHTIFEVDRDSPEAFIAWEQDKTIFKNHNFEIFAGHGFSCCHLYPRLKEDGWRLDLFGSIPFHGEDLFIVWETFNNAGLPTYLSGAKALADAFMGDDYLIAVPDYQWTVYQNGTYDGHEVIDAIHLPEENQEAVVAMVDWFPVNVSPLR